MNPSPPTSLGETIREARLDKDLTLRELARRLKKTPSYVSDIENDRRTPSEEVLQDIARELSLEFTDLLARAGRVGKEAQRLIQTDPQVAKLFRTISEMTPAQRERIMKQAEKADRDRKKR